MGCQDNIDVSTQNLTFLLSQTKHIFQSFTINNVSFKVCDKIEMTCGITKYIVASAHCKVDRDYNSNCTKNQQLSLYIWYHEVEK